MRKTLVIALSLGLVTLVMTPPPAAANRPEDLPPGSIVSLFVGGEGFGGPTEDTTVFLHEGRWERLPAFGAACEGESTRDQRRALRDVKKLLRPYAQENLFFDSGGADLQLFEISTVHGTVSWMSGADLPEDVAEAADLLFTMRLEITDSVCFD